MVVTDVTALSSSKYNVYVDGKFAFALYKGELFRYKIEEDKEIDQETFLMIRNEIVLKRAKLRALHLLTDMDRSEKQLIDKLKSNNYSDDIIQDTIGYVKSFGYINDLRVAKNIVRSKKNNKSKKEIRVILYNKGISSEDIETALEEELEQDDEQEAIREILRKKKFNFETATEKEFQKLCASLSRKGFRYSDIRQVVDFREWDA